MAKIYLAFFLATVIALAATGPHVDARSALLEIQDLGHWGNDGLALMIGQISAVFALGGMPNTHTVVVCEVDREC